MSSESATVVKRAYFLDHEKGTKFYEVVSIWLPERSVGVLIKRWGKAAVHARQGGQVKTEYFDSARALEASSQEILYEKRRGNKDGKYHDVVTSFGIHAAPTSFDELLLPKQMIAHYGMNNGVEICAKLGASVSGREESVVEEGAVEEVAPEPARAGDWGSW